MFTNPVVECGDFRFKFYSNKFPKGRTQGDTNNLMSQSNLWIDLNQFSVILTLYSLKKTRV